MGGWGSGGYESGGLHPSFTLFDNIPLTPVNGVSYTHKKLPRQHQFSSYCFLHSLHLIYLQHESKCNQTDAGTVMCLKFFPKGCVRMKRDLKHLKRIQKGRIAKIGEKMVYNVTLMTFSIAHSGMLTSM